MEAQLVYQAPIRAQQAVHQGVPVQADRLVQQVVREVQQVGIPKLHPWGKMLFRRGF